MFSKNIKTILSDLKKKELNIMLNSELIELFMNGIEKDKKLACLIILASDNRDLSIYRDPNLVMNMFNPLMKELLLESFEHYELGNLIIDLYTNFNFDCKNNIYKGGKSTS